MGKSVVLIEPGQHLGGLTSGGLGATDIGNKQAIGGISREFYQRICASTTRTRRSLEPGEAQPSIKGHGHEPKDDTIWTLRAARGRGGLPRHAAEAKVPVVFGQRLDLAKGVRKEGPRIVSITMESGETYRRQDVHRRHLRGRPDGQGRRVATTSAARRTPTYGETLNGVQMKNARHHQFIKAVDPYVKPGDRTSGLLPGVVAGTPRHATARATAACRPTTFACAPPTAPRTVGLGPSRTTTTRNTTNCCCATSRPAISVSRGTRRSDAQPQDRHRTTTAPSPPTTSA